MRRLLSMLALSISILGLTVLATHAKSPGDLQGTLLVVSKTDNSVSFIDIASAKIVKTLPTGQGPHELVISEDGLWAVVSDFVGGDSLTVIDIANQKVARTIDLKKYPRPHGIQFLADQDLISATSGRTNSLVIANIQQGTIANVIDTTQQGTHMVTVQPDKNVAYTSNMRSNTLAKLDLSTNTFVRTFSTAQTPEAIRLSPAGDELWYGANKKGLVKVIDLSTSAEIAEFSGFSFPYRVLFTKDEQLAVIPDFRMDYVRFFNAKTKQEIGKLSLNKGDGPQGVIFHPNDKTLFLSLNSSSEIAVIDAQSREVVQRIKGVANPDGIGYTHLVFN